MTRFTKLSHTGIELPDDADFADVAAIHLNRIGLLVSTTLPCGGKGASWTKAGELAAAHQLLGEPCRLPTRAEAAFLCDLSRHSPTLDPEIARVLPALAEDGGGWVWTSEKSAWYGSDAWFVSLNGGSSAGAPQNYKGLVLAVRTVPLRRNTMTEWNGVGGPTNTAGKDAPLEPCPFCDAQLEVWQGAVWHKKSECPLSLVSVSVELWNRRAPKVAAAEHYASEGGGCAPHEPVAATIRVKRDDIAEVNAIIERNPYTTYSFPAPNNAVERQRASRYARMIALAAMRGTRDCAREVVADMRAENLIGAKASFQQRVEPWLLKCFGAEIAGDKTRRNQRFLEEALELVQACGCERSEAHQLVDYVFDRPTGEKLQEAGGAMVTLAALCRAQGMDMHEAGETELARCWAKIEQIRAESATKPKYSPLPQPSDPPKAVVATGGGGRPSAADAEPVSKSVAKRLAAQCAPITSKSITPTTKEKHDG